MNALDDKKFDKRHISLVDAGRTSNKKHQLLKVTYTNPKYPGRVFDSSLITFTFNIAQSEYSTEEGCYLFYNLKVAREHLMLAIVASVSPSIITGLFGKSEDYVSYKGPKPKDTEDLKGKIEFVMFKSAGYIKIVDGSAYFNDKGLVKIENHDKCVCTLIKTD